jgi:hypothetical protein
MGEPDDEGAEWVELSREDALFWLRCRPQHLEHDDELPVDSVAKVRRLGRGLLELRVEHADGSTWILRDLQGDETPDELRALAGLDENDDENDA